MYLSAKTKKKDEVSRMDLNERKMRILKSIIDEYIDKGEPVGSKHLVEYGNISLSPATIRNEMSELEEMGYLDKPHTSAGRIPSNAAYRIYVEQLMENYRLNVEELSLLNELSRFKMEKMDKLVSRVGRVISEITNCASVAMMTSPKKHMVSRYDVVLIDEHGFLLVMVLPDGSVKSEHIRTELVVDEKAVLSIKLALNELLCEVSLSEVALPTMLELEKRFGRYASLVSIVVRTAYESVCDIKTEDVKIDGITNLLSYPEFKDVGKVKNLLSLVEEKHDSIKSIFSNNVESDDKQFKVYIGDENNIEELSDTSVVYCSMPVGNGQNAVIGIIGPKRMDYRKVIGALKSLSETLGNSTPLLAGDSE